MLLCLFVCVLLWAAYRDPAFSILGVRGVKKSYDFLSETKFLGFIS